MLITAVGAFLVLFGIVFAGFLFYWRHNNRTSPFKNPGLIVSLAIFCGFVLLLPERITEFEFAGAKVRAAAQQATTDADVIAKLRERVENQSATVDLIASQAAKAKELSELASSQTKQAAQKVEELNDVTKAANATLLDLKEEEEFLMLAVAAQNDDRLSFDKLENLENSTTSHFSKMARAAWSTIYEAHNGPISQAGLTVPWLPEVEPSKFSFDKLKGIYKDTLAAVKPALLEYIWNRADFSKTEKMDFMITVMRNDSSLNAFEYAGRHFTEGAQLNIKPMALKYLSDWWDKHRNEFASREETKKQDNP